MLLGVFGGTFDPIHNGHLIIAELIREVRRLDRVLFVPASRPPHKPAGAIASYDHRIAMARLAVRGHDAFEVSTIEQDTRSPSYTTETLSRLQAAHPNDRLFLLLGADSLAALPTWKDPDRLIQQAAFLVFPRAGVAWADIPERLRRNATLVDVPLLDVSSTWIRERLAQGRSVRYFVPDAVLAYMREHQVYGKTS